MNHFRVISSAKSPRIEPGAARPVGGADQLTGSRNGFGPLEHGGHQHPPGDELDQLTEERLLAVLGVVVVGDRFGGPSS